ncbi:hypothetical protein PWY87_32145 [Kribbella solani]|uniref:hypothetical protein n=1 Tax=Kribbella solani TaxID=236067 RepID=UPI0029AFF767|nr:hypothetical protein [Kribbella solani]MDX2970849.1 hypothetical protein [Kribbella solani]MDX3006372.1 hypothetical protein [Kribbella solani]
MSQQYPGEPGNTATMITPAGDASSTQRYEEARAAASRAMSTIAIDPDESTSLIGTQSGPLGGTQSGPQSGPGGPGGAQGGSLGGAVRPSPPVRASAEDDLDPELLSYRGFKFGAAFFGWLIAIAMSVLLLAAVSAAAFGTAQLLDYGTADAKAQPGAAALTAAGVGILMLTIAFYAGGYVAGRLARFDGGRQGFGVWVIALLVGAIAGGTGWLLDNQYDLVGDINRPDVALSNSTLALGAAAAAGALLLFTLLAAIIGGKSGRRYHDRIDELL